MALKGNFVALYPYIIKRKKRLKLNELRSTQLKLKKKNRWNQRKYKQRYHKNKYRINEIGIKYEDQKSQKLIIWKSLINIWQD